MFNSITLKISVLTIALVTMLSCSGISQEDLDLVSTNLDNTQTKLTEAETTLMDTNRKLMEADNRIVLVETMLNASKKRIVQVESELFATNGLLKDTEGELRITTTTLTDTNNKLSNSEANLTDTKSLLTTTQAKLTEAKIELTALQLKLNTAEITLKQNVDLENQIKEGLLVLDMLSEFMNFGLMASSGELQKLSGSQQVAKIKRLTDTMDAGTKAKDLYLSSRMKLLLDNMLAEDDGQLTDDRATEILFIELLPRGIEIIRGEK